MNNADLTLVLLVIAFAATMVGRFLVRRLNMRFRRIPAYDALPLLAATAVESNYRLHFALGTGALGQSSTVNALTGAEILYRMAERLVVAEQTPMVTLSSAMTLPLAQDTLRRAYEYRNRLDSWHNTQAIWYPPGRQGFAYVAGAASLSADRDIYSNVLLGRYGYELALFGEGALRKDQGLIAHSDLLEGQAIAFVQADRVLLGEELYVGPAYLDGNALQRGGIVALETLRWLVILAIIIEVLLAAL